MGEDFIRTLDTEGGVTGDPNGTGTDPHDTGP